MLVGKLTIEQKESIEGQLVCPDVYFNPTLDVNQDWFISSEEIDNSIYPEHEWVKDLTLSVYQGPYVPQLATPLPSNTTINQ